METLSLKYLGKEEEGDFIWHHYSSSSHPSLAISSNLDPIAFTVTLMNVTLFLNYVEGLKVIPPKYHQMSFEEFYPSDDWYISFFEPLKKDQLPLYTITSQDCFFRIFKKFENLNSEAPSKPVKVTKVSQQKQMKKAKPKVTILHLLLPIGGFGLIFFLIVRGFLSLNWTPLRPQKRLVSAYSNLDVYVQNQNAQRAESEKLTVVSRNCISNDSDGNSMVRCDVTLKFPGNQEEETRTLECFMTQGWFAGKGCAAIENLRITK
jgi:hypothetical protein